MPTEAQIVPHCDDPPCSLGRVEYTCPGCQKSFTDYGDLWWDNHRIFDAGLSFSCEGCKIPLRIYYDKVEMTVLVDFEKA